MNVYFTVDTESSIGGALVRADREPVGASKHVFCRIGGEEFGVPLLIRVMKGFGFCGTFFVETLATRCLGEAETAAVFECLLQAKQDVQLHIHPAFWFLSEVQKARALGAEYRLPAGPDRIGHFDKELQMQLLGEAIRYFEKFAGYKPLAFRAGCFAGSRSMMQCLKYLGVRVDSSFNPCYHPDLSFPDVDLEPNRVQILEGVLEIPITVARTRLPEGYGGFRFADCTSISFSELRTMLDVAAAAGQEHFVIVFHSFSAVKARDYRFMEMRPNRIVIRRLERLFAYLAQNTARFRVETMGNLAAAGSLDSLGRALTVPRLPLMQSVCRKAIQFVNNAYWV